MTDRKKRSDDTRAKSEARKPWEAPEALLAPDPPDGYKHRWLRIETYGNMDKTNLYAKLREGWELVRKDEYPDFDGPEIDEGKYVGIIGNGGLVLARMPIETIAERNEHYGLKTRGQMEAVDNDFLRESDEAVPLSGDRDSRITFGGVHPSE